MLYKDILSVWAPYKTQKTTPRLECKISGTF